MEGSPKTFSLTGLVFPDYIIPKRLSYHFFHNKKGINISDSSFKEKNTLSTTTMFDNVIRFKNAWAKRVPR